MTFIIYNENNTTPELKKLYLLENFCTNHIFEAFFFKYVRGIQL